MSTAASYSGGYAYVQQAVNFYVFGESLGEETIVPSAAQGTVLGKTWKITHSSPRSGCVQPQPIGATAYQAGTIRFGRDPESSALDVNCKAHDLDNLYVVDTSFFPSIGAVNPSLTAIANALRVGDHIAERLQ